MLTFKFGSLAAFVLVPFAVLSKTAFIAERRLGWVVGSGVRLMVLTLVLGVGNNIFQSLKVPGRPDGDDLSGILHRAGGAAADGACRWSPRGWPLT